MKFAAYTALIAAAQAKIHDACTDTWEGATGCTPAEGDPEEQCFDWQTDNDAKTSSGLMCGLKSLCASDSDHKFSHKDTEGKESNYYAECTGLSGTACTKENQDTACDKMGGFKCEYWTPKTNGNGMWGCAHEANECGKEVNNNMVSCTGFVGDDCKMNTDCVSDLDIMCAMEFNKTDLKFKSGTNKCAEKTKCNADVADSNKTMAYVCYDDHLTGCNDTTPCTTPEGDNGAATCGYIKVGNATANISSGGMCIDDGECNKDNATAGKTI